MSVAENKSLLDYVGIGVSSLCALHCVMLPVLIPVLPLLGASIFAEHWFERSILILSMVIGFVALVSGFYRYHRQLYPVYSLMLGGFLYWNKDMLGENMEPVIVVVGAALIVGSHALNIRLCKSCNSCKGDH